MSPLTPTLHPPRSLAKIRLLARRAKLRLPLFHPLDAGASPRVALIAQRLRNGTDSRGPLVLEGIAGELVILEGYRRRKW